MSEEPRYNVIRDEVVPLLKDISDELGNLMSAHAQTMLARQREDRNNDVLVALKTSYEAMDKKLDTFLMVQSGFEARQRDLEAKVTKIMAYGGAAVVLLNLLVHLFGK